MTFPKSLVAASSRSLILGILQQGSSYGYEIIQKVRELSGGKLEWADGMMYPVLHKLEKEGLIESKWVQSDGGRHRKYYFITASGKAMLHTEKKQWNMMNEIMVRLWDLETR